ncbi:MAG: ferredoxin-thioredoxin reductase variable chain [Gloeobacterales cyanobacterium]
MTIEIGSRVRVKKPVVVYTHPDHKSQPYDIKGMEGVVDAVFFELQGRPISANYPYRVKFLPRFKAHLGDEELELIETPVEA